MFWSSKYAVYMKVFRKMFDIIWVFNKFNKLFCHNCFQITPKIIFRIKNTWIKWIKNKSFLTIRLVRWNMQSKFQSYVLKEVYITSN